MKKLFSCLFTALCLVGLSVPALADPIFLPDVVGHPLILFILVVAVVALAVAIIIRILNKHKK